MSSTEGNVTFGLRKGADLNLVMHPLQAIEAYVDMFYPPESQQRAYDFQQEAPAAPQDDTVINFAARRAQMRPPKETSGHSADPS